MTAPRSLWQAFAEVPDPRDASGRRYPLQAVLTLCVVSMLSGARSLYAIAQFGRDRGVAFARALGFERETTPCCTTLHYLFVDLDVPAFERAIQDWLESQAAEGWRALSVDGKTLRGTAGHQIPGVHLLAAYAHEARAVLSEVPVDADTNEHKTALKMLGMLPLHGSVVLGDAAFCQRDLSGLVVKRGAHYVWTVKENQPELRHNLEALFEDRDFSPVGACGRQG